MCFCPVSYQKTNAARFTPLRFAPRAARCPHALNLWRMLPYTIALSILAFPLLMMAAQAPTIADAQAFMDRTETELLKIGTMQQRAQWVQETYITGDTELLAASEDERVIARTTELINESKRFESLNVPPDLKRKFLLLKLALTLPAPQDARLREELTQVAASL